MSSEKIYALSQVMLQPWKESTTFQTGVPMLLDVISEADPYAALESRQDTVSQGFKQFLTVLKLIEM